MKNHTTTQPVPSPEEKGILRDTEILVEKIINATTQVNRRQDREVLIDYSKKTLMIDGFSKKGVLNFSYTVRLNEPNINLSLNNALRDIEGLL